MTVLHLPTGVTAKLIDLNLHDLRQYYMYQMDMIEQAKDMLDTIASWVKDIDNEPSTSLTVEAKTTPPAVFHVAIGEGNLLPTRYVESDWQGVVHTNGVRSYPRVSKMTVEQLHTEIANQYNVLQHFQSATVALGHLANNVSRGTQEPSY